MKLETYCRILSIFLPFVLITLVSSSSIPVAEVIQEEDAPNSDGLFLGSPVNSKLNSHVKTKSAWAKNHKKPLYFQKSSQHKLLKTSEEHVNQWETKENYHKKINPKMSGSKGNFSAHSLNNKPTDVLTCANDDPEMQQVCKNFCTQVKQFNLGFCSSDQQTCICSMEGDDAQEATLRVKLYKPKQQQPLTEQDLKSNAEELASQENFECDHSEFSEKVCSAYCYQFKQFNHSKCAEDGKSCLCFSTETQLNPNEDIKDGIASRSARQFLPEDSEAFLDERSPVSTEDNDGIPISVKGRRPLVPRPLKSRLGCSTYSCMYVCPAYCQSMCMHAVECYCSCPEDLYYDYEDYYFPLIG